MNRKQLAFVAVFSAMCFASGVTTNAQELFRDEMSSGAGWGVNASSGDSAATFGYDYSDDGIPEAPNSRGGDAATTGVKMEANITVGALDVFTLYPTGQNFTDAYVLRFDAWMNYDVNEVVNGGSAGTTEFLGGGIGYNGTAADVGSGAQVLASGDGGSGSDWRAFKSPPAFFVPAADMVAGDRNGANAYYADFLLGVAPPAAQGQPALAGIAGSPGFQWITFEFSVFNSLVDVTIEKPDGSRLPLVSMDCGDTSDGSSGCTTDGNISLSYADFFSSVSARPDLMFGVIDNVEVRVPEPASMLLAFFGCVALGLARRRR